MDLTVITVSWNSEKYIENQIKSVQRSCADLKYEYILVDNDSEDDTVEIAKLKRVKVIKNSKNLGFGRANNKGVEIATGKYILFLNPDMDISKGTSMKDMVKYMDNNEKVAVMSCKLVDKKNRENQNQGPRRFPRAWEMICLMLKIPHVFPSILNNYHYCNKDLTKIQNVDSVRGSFMLTRTDIINECGGFDERYFLWLEEVDLCRQIKKKGKDIIYNPNFSCVDHIGKSFSKVDNFKKQKQFTESLLIYFKKWHPMYVWMWIKLFRPVGILLVWLFKR